MTDYKYTFGNEKFGGSFNPGNFELRFPGDMTREDFEKIFNERLEQFNKHKEEFTEEFFDKKSRKEKLKPLSIRVKPHTKEFYKNNSILSPREVLEMYEEYNNGSEAFINSLLEEEKELENDLSEIQEKLHNARLFKEKLAEMEPPTDVLTDEDKLLKLKQNFKKSKIKEIGNETSPKKAKNDIITTIQMYNTLEIIIYEKQVVSFVVYTDSQPVVYYFKNEYSEDEFEEITAEIENFAEENEITLTKKQIFEEKKEDSIKS